MSMQKLWNEKFSREGYLYGTEPNAFLKEQLKSIAPGSHILFLGEGEGRNACYAASAGFKVTALDASDIGLAKCRALAESLNVTIETLHVDLVHWEPAISYDVIMSSFLHLSEPLRTQSFTKAINALHEGGLFIAEFFSKKQLEYSSGGPKSPELLYSTDELANLFSTPSLSQLLLSECIDYLDESDAHRGEASLIRVIIKKHCHA